ncbi:hypothetical protein OHB26_31340 [Nocardia sp. NBC_01503]|uniref:hypothetical protein n=1 Tax=Nocardia sp. NBC_01503 TaxID=2975997 RepID=UPI002E7B748C|nr:hypothetical protein [Nocardia sp. NBC_01503]WTL31369.1 hypothetical protein OHB26_31340 [Nocardia sp. NBC_01503]
MVTDHTAGSGTPDFTVEDVTVGRYAHGFGVTGDGRSFAFRTVRSTLTLEIYRPDLDTEVPAAEDVVAVAVARVTDIDLDDERSIIALVRDLIPEAVPVGPPQPLEASTVRALLGRLSAVIEGM